MADTFFGSKKVESPKAKATVSNPPSSPNPVVPPATVPKKKTSFQITSVTVGSSRLSNDGGDDSADDLDESHTDDISRITDNETPSFSEDTLSRDEFVSNVIPTSAQYGLAILPEQSQIQPNVTATQTNPIQVNTVNSVSLILEEIVNNSTMSGCFTPPRNLNSSPSKVAAQSVSPRGGIPIQSNPVDRPETPSKEMAETSQPQRSERFKVVKIESTEPFRRGRWMCMDYLDHSVNQPHNSPFIKSSVEPSTNGLNNNNHQLINPPQTLPVPVQMQNGQNGNIQSSHHPATTINYQPVHQQTNSPVQPQQPSPNPPPPSQQQPPPEYHPIFNQPSPITSPPIQIPGQTYSGPATSVNNSTPIQPQTYSGQQIQQQFIGTNYPDVVATSTPIVTSTVTSLPIATIAESQSSITLNRTPSLTNIQVLTQPAPATSTTPQMLMLNSPTTSAIHSLEQQQPISTNPVVPTDSTVQQGAAAAALQPATDDESGSAASTVAIDNKIEQAMDLVKSHLMFAVREEVEVLKEKIAELMDRINQLEIENSILKSHATPDVLQQLPSPQTQLIYGNVTTIPTSLPNTTSVKTTTTTTSAT